jgi:hypothetical protein
MGGGFDDGALVAHLKDPRSVMSQGAKSLGSPTPKLKNDGIQSLLRYLKILAIGLPRGITPAGY